MHKKQIPNILSIIRLLMVPLFVFVYFSGQDRAKSLVLAAVIYSLAGFTDIVDGYLARKYNWITTLGKILDPLADKLMQAAAAVCLVIDKLLPIWVCAVFFLKEIFMLIGGLIIFKKRRTMVVSNWYGKFATAVFYAVVMILIICSALCPVMPSWIHTILGAILAGVIVFAIIMYYLKTFKGKFGMEMSKQAAE
ncbi:MAG: hypothetical protein A2Y17_10785 [Clostridiales bacterium GWF2_38_85]|nr:MAG: hypothetical protein A2Y17_10785 [Clostridiales bacterium GWF2_38_85]